MKLPIPYIHGSDVQIKRIDTNTIMSVFEKQQEGKIYDSMLQMLIGSIESLDDKKPSIAELKLMPMVSAEYVVLEAFKLYGLPTKVEGVYHCPRIGCGNRIIHEHGKDYDNRIDINSLPINFCEKEELNSISFNSPLKIEKKDFQAEISSYSFRNITIGDLIELSNSKGNLKNRIHEILYKTFTYAEFVSEPSITFEQLKNRYKLEIFNFPDYSMQEDILLGFRKYGIQLFIPMTCDSCGKEWENAVDFTSFFGYALSFASKSQSRA